MSDSIKKWEEIKEANKLTSNPTSISLNEVRFNSTSTADFFGKGNDSCSCDSCSCEDVENIKNSKRLSIYPEPDTLTEDSAVNEKQLVLVISAQPDFKKITDSIADLLKYKNVKYGNSALEPMDIFQGKCKVGQRLDDKIARVKNGGELQKNDIADLIGYLTLVCVEKGWDNFEEFKD